jgi:hypothetical protein
MCYAMLTGKQLSLFEGSSSPQLQDLAMQSQGLPDLEDEALWSYETLETIYQLTALPWKWTYDEDFK